MLSQFERHIFVCNSGKTCPRQGAAEVVAALRREAKAAGITDRIRVNQCGCLAQCGYGPMAVVHPGAVWYAALTPEDAPRIVHEHLIGGRPVEERLHAPPGPGVQICPRGEEPIPPAEIPPDVAS